MKGKKKEYALTEVAAWQNQAKCNKSQSVLSFETIDVLVYKGQNTTNATSFNTLHHFVVLLPSKVGKATKK